MSVAKSYEKYSYLGDPYEHDKRQYIKIKYPCCKKAACTKCHGEGYYPKEVRWYDEPFIIDHRHAFGFRQPGYITLLLGPQDILEYHFREVAPRQARYNTIFQWFIPSYLPIPELPKGISTKVLKWEDISTNGVIHNYDDIRALVQSFYGISVSRYVGAVGDKIENDFEVIKAVLKDARYGNAYTYTLIDSNSNLYSWTTAARKLEVGEIYHLKGSIKDHLKIEGKETTILTRCREG